jgi:Ca2+-binding EF-hand superfamily protein
VSSQSDIRKKLKLAFKYYDIKKNGTIDKEEMYKMITAIYELKGEFELTGEIFIMLVF